jgi:hypothetical protein
MSCNEMSRVTCDEQIVPKRELVRLACAMRRRRSGSMMVGGPECELAHTCPVELTAGWNQAVPSVSQTNLETVGWRNLDVNRMGEESCER